MWVGKDAGLFAKNGLNIEPVQIRGGAVSTMAIMSGQSVLSGVGAGSVVAARVEGGDIVLLACPADLEPVYLIARPEIKSAAELKGKAAGVTRLNSSIHFYLRSALRMVGVDSDKEMTLLQLGGSAEITTALEGGRIAAAALTIKDVLPFMQRDWPVLADLTKSDLVYPSSCVTSTRAFVKADPKTVNCLLERLRERHPADQERSKTGGATLIKWLKEKESANLSKSVEAFVRLFNPMPYVPDKGIENILKDLALQRPVPKEFYRPPGAVSRQRSVGESAAEVMKSAFLLFVIIVFSPLVNPNFARTEELRRILYGTTASPSHLPIWVAKDAGFFEKDGLNVEPVQIRGGSLITLAIITGDLPFSGAGAESVVAPGPAGGDVVLLACPVDADPVYLITRPEIKSAQDLKGQASAVTRYGSTTHFICAPRSNTSA